MARTIFGVTIFKILQHRSFKMAHSIYRLAGLAGQFWKMESTLGLHEPELATCVMREAYAMDEL